MIRKLLIVVAFVVAGVLVSAPAAQATCTTGRVGFDKNTKQVYLELPECHPREP